ncbi:MAG: hypothetical protein ACRC8E_10595 [Plesiomonas shigelloides]
MHQSFVIALSYMPENREQMEKVFSILSGFIVMDGSIPLLNVHLIGFYALNSRFAVILTMVAFSQKGAQRLFCFIV